MACCGKAKKLKQLINKDEEVKLWNDKFYYAYRWKNHNKYKEIGDILGCSEGAVKVRIFRALNDLRKIYSKLEN